MDPRELIIVDSQAPSTEMRTPPPLVVAIAAWLDSKKQRSNSPRTERAYRDTLLSFQRHLHAQGLDLDSPADLTGYLQAWAGQGEIARATFNHRLAVVSSFYRFAAKRRYLSVPNPAEGIERGKVQAYAKAQPLKADDVKRRLAAIDQSTLAGKRDYALLHIALNTGRRRAELANLRYGDLRLEGDRVLLTWQRAKGGKVLHDLVPKSISAALLRYLHAAYGATLGTLAANAPVWIALDTPHYGHALTAQALADLCERHLGTSKVHTTRHTFAHEMEATGAKVTEIRDRLGQQDVSTTNAYLAALNAAYNPYAEQLADRFGAE